MVDKILGIDPGLVTTGWGIIERGNTCDLKYIASGVIRSNTISKNSQFRGKKEDFLHERITYIFKILSDVISNYKPTVAAIENTYVNINQHSSLKLAHARAAAIIACSVAGLTVSEYQAKTIKKILVGTGKAEKVQLSKFLSFYLPNMRQNITVLDESDAIAIAVCHAQFMGNRMLNIATC